MTAVSFFPAVLAVLLALATSKLLVWRFGVPSLQGRFAAIDGLRGYLAFFVFLHHACVWYFFSHGVPWRAPPSHLYNHFGQSAVALFFMITAFLFWSKLLDGKRNGIDWRQLYQSRLVRLLPLYWTVLAALLLVLAWRTGFAWQVPWQSQVGPLLSWLWFTAGGMPDLNGVANTAQMVAGVTWSLPYEWLFYLLLPLAGWRMRIDLPRWAWLVALAAVVWWLLWRPDRLSMLFFLGGITAAYAVRRPAFCQWAQGGVASGLVLLLLGLTVWLFPGLHDLPGKWLKYVPLLLLSLAFVLIAAGNSLFGLLHLPVSRMLGEVSYSMYLWHGLLLYLALQHFWPTAQVVAWTPQQFWLAALALVPLLVLWCYASFRLIEAPPMNWLKRRRAQRNP